MKTLVNEMTGRKDFPIFKGSFEQILDWINKNLDFFDLNQLDSCKVSTIGKDKIEIYGVHDFEVFRVIDVQFIEL